MAGRTKFTYSDRYAFFNAWSGRCGYCRLLLQFRDFEIDHIIPWHRSQDSAGWRALLEKLKLDPAFDVDGDLNLRPICGPCNQSKTGDELPEAHIILLLNEASRKAPDVSHRRGEEVSRRKINMALATLEKAGYSGLEIAGKFSGELPVLAASEISPWPNAEAERLVKVAFGAASSNLLAWPQVTLGRWIERPEAELLEQAMMSSEKRVIALLGPAGCGKSAMLARLGTKLSCEGRILLAIKADMLPSHVASMPDLDGEWGLTEPLPIVLERLASEAPLVILIDQLDALAPLMDSKSNRFSAMLALVNRALLIPNVTVVVSCRKFDAEYDIRLRATLHSANLVELVDPPWENVEPLLQSGGYAPGAWPQSTKALLARPQNLKMFLEHFKSGNEAPAFTTLQAMLERVLEDLAREFGTGPERALDAIVATMSESESLWVPLAPLRQAFPSEILRLEQADLVKRDTAGLQVGLTHQTLFEFLRGRAFVFGPVDLVEEVFRKQSGLSIRPVLWHALAYLRLSNPGHYRRSLKRLFDNSEIRLHIKLLLVDFLGTLRDPVAEEAECLKGLLSQSVLRPHVMKAVEGNAAWLSLLREAIAGCYRDGPAAAWQASFVLGPALAFDPDFVLSTIEAYWLKHVDLDGSTFNVFRDCTDWNERMAEILRRIVARTDIGETFVGHCAVLMAKTRPDLAVGLVRVKLDFDLAKARASIDPEVAPEAEGTLDAYFHRHLLESRRLKPLARFLDQHGGWYELQEIAKIAPGDVIEGIWDWADELSILLSQSSKPSPVEYLADHEWHFGRTYASHLTAALWKAAPPFAKAQPERFATWVRRASQSETTAIHELIRRGLIEIAREHPSTVFEYLVGDHRRLKDTTECRTVDLLVAIRESLGVEEELRLADWIDTWQPYYMAEVNEEFREKYEKYAADGRRQLREALSGAIQSIVPLTMDSTVEDDASWTPGPPVTTDEMEKMSDEELLATLAEWPDSRESGDDYRTGGSTYVANQF